MLSLRYIYIYIYYVNWTDHLYTDVFIKACDVIDRDLLYDYILRLRIMCQVINVFCNVVI